ncbi:universal stress protein [Labedella populi]|uniref:Universal stress protein n=1 Tax=Labedella populi TaxID=2498850 RepID=A0A444Q602_9MICO|nr:universal stress protein [Labedella populi]RWZ59206.1 universal stress protein [Labedella populi]
MTTTDGFTAPLGEEGPITAHPRPIIVGVDGSTESIIALRTAGRVAELTGAPLRAVLAWQYPSVAYDGYATMLDWSPEAQARDDLSATLSTAFGAASPDDLSSSTRPGAPAPVLIAAARHASLLVVGSRGHGGFAGLLLGSVSEAVARHSPCPVLITRGPEDVVLRSLSTTDERPIVVGVDGSPASLEALRIAGDAAHLLGSPLHVVIAWRKPASFVGGRSLPPAWSPEDDARENLHRSATRVLGRSLPPGTALLTREGPAAPVLLEAARGARAVVMGARGHGGFAGLLLGSATEAVIRHSPVPVLIVPDSSDRAERIEAMTPATADGGLPPRPDATARSAPEGEHE